jgi:hypothetical protein
VFIVGITISAIVDYPRSFFTNLGFMLAGTSLGIGVTVWIIQTILNERADEVNRLARISLLRAVGREFAMSPTTEWTSPWFGITALLLEK